MTIHYADATVTLHHGDCLDVLRSLPDASVDSVVTDPPYGLEFMGREWDSFARQDTTAQRSNAGGFGDEEGKPWNKARSGTKGVRSTFRCRTCQGWSGTFSEARAKRQKACECESPDYDYAGAPAQTVAFGKWCEAWAVECLRVLKPGGHMLAFGGTRTWHRLACAVEDAGFEVRDSIAWLYGSGFPKSLDVSKAIDKAAGAEREVVGYESRHRNRPETPAWVKSAAAMKHDPRPGEPTPGGQLSPIAAPATPAAEQWQGWGTALKPAFEPVVVARKPLVGTVAGNVLAHGTGALSIDGCRIGTDGGTARSKPRGVQSKETGWAENDDGHIVGIGAGRWPANVVLDESQAEALDEQSGTLTSGKMRAGTKPKGERETYGQDAAGGYETQRDTPGDVGGASRFFYVAKADQSERPRVNGTAHPTVKPIDLMRWLVRLVTPPGGTVLEPFAGSGTTVEACIVEGFRCIAIERADEYLPLIEARIARRRDPVKAITLAGEDLGLFGEAVS